MTSARDRDVEAFVVDRYLEGLLARRPVDPGDVPPDVRRSGLRLAADLPRFHPSFRFEERLAGTLASLAAGRPADAVAELMSFPSAAVSVSDPASAPPAGTIRPVVIGGVLTSAALSLAGAAFVAWRWAHPSPDTTMARAVRAVARTRTT